MARYLMKGHTVEHNHEWKLRQWDSGQFSAMCWVDNCGQHLTHNQIAALLNEHADKPYTGRHCMFCLQEEHLEPTAYCGYRKERKG